MTDRIRICGSGWNYCDGDCLNCPIAHFICTNKTTVIDNTVVSLETQKGGEGMYELKPCPFCGGKAELREKSHELPFSCGERNIFFVICTCCGCSPFPKARTTSITGVTARN